MKQFVKILKWTPIFLLVVYAQNQLNQELIAQALLKQDPKAEQIKKKFTNANSTPISEKNTQKSVIKDSKLLSTNYGQEDSNFRLKSKLLLEIDTNRFESRLFQNFEAPRNESDKMVANSSYTLKSGDEILVNFWGEVEKSFDITLANGLTSIPGFGSVGLLGLTAKEAEEAIYKKMLKSISSLESGKTQLNVQILKMSPVQITITGEVAQPGRYTLPPGSDVFQSLYYAKGPAKSGSLRNIILKRRGKSYSLDFYAYFFDGRIPKGAMLDDGDVLVIPKSNKLVEIKGEVQRPAVYDLKSSEGLADLIRYSGGPTSKASRKTVIIQRLFDDDRKDYLNVDNALPYFNGRANYKLQSFDLVTVFESQEEARSYFKVAGAIKYPGDYAYKTGLNLSQALKIAGGFKHNAFADQVEVFRRVKNNQWGVSSIDSKDFGTYQLSSRDSIHVYDYDSLKTDTEVSISGSIKRAGSFTYHQGMSIQDLILLAGGSLPNWEKGAVQVERIDALGNYHILTESITLNFELLPKDRVVLLVDPNFRNQEVVTLSGAFQRPGSYSKASLDETLSAFLKRIGAFDSKAYPVGAQFFRKPYEVKDTSMALCVQELHNTQANAVKNEGYSQSFMNDSLRMISEDSIQRTCQLRIRLNKKQLIQKIPIHLENILKGNSTQDFILKDGDSLFVPSRPINISVRGAVLSPGEVLYEEGKGESYYIKKAGGFSFNADDGRVVVTFANGERTKAGWFTKNPDPGSEIYVAELPPADGKSMQWISTLGTLTVGLSGVILTYIAATRK